MNAWQGRPDLLGLAGAVWEGREISGSNTYTEGVAYAQDGTVSVRERQKETAGCTLTYTAKCVSFDVFDLPKLNEVFTVTAENQTLFGVAAKLIVTQAVLTTGNGNAAIFAVTLEPYLACETEDAPTKYGFATASNVHTNRLTALLFGLTNVTGSTITNAVYTLSNLESFTTQDANGTWTKGGRGPQLGAVLTVEACTSFTTAPKPTSASWTIDDGTMTNGLRKFVQWNFNAFKWASEIVEA